MKVLETERMTLRWFDPSNALDPPFVLALLNDPAWIANIGDRNVRTVDEARQWIEAKLVASYWRNGHGLWAMERRADGVLLGMCGLIARDSLPDIDLGYALLPAFRGHGYAREAALACLRYGHEVLGSARILAIVTPTNEASVRVLASVGMVRGPAHREPARPEAELASFVWDAGAAPAEEPDATRAIDALVARFFAAFSSRVETPIVAALPAMFLPEAIVTILRPGTREPEVLSVRDFVAPRAALLTSGRLVGFAEAEISARTLLGGGMASRASRYRKEGRLDGSPVDGEGDKHFQLVQTSRGWKIAALTYGADEPPAGRVALEAPTAIAPSPRMPEPRTTTDEEPPARRP